MGVHSIPQVPAPFTITVLENFAPVLRTFLSLPLCVITLSPTWIWLMGLNPSSQSTKASSGKQGDPPISKSTLLLYLVKSSLVTSPWWTTSGKLACVALIALFSIS